MRARTWFLSLAVRVLAAGVGLGACSYDPHIMDGELRCSSAGKCPSGYTCSNNLCFGSSSSSADAGSGDDATGSPLPLVRYIGSWTLDPTASVTTHCDNGSLDVQLLSPADKPSVMKIAAGVVGQSDLQSIWLCTLGLSVDASGAHLHDSSPTCSDSSMDPKETWTATKFEVVINGLRSANHTAAYNRTDEYANGTTVTCSQMVTAPLTKN